MPLDLFAGLVVFACVMAFTPGPNNILLAASGVNFGFTRTVPHMAGVTLGFFILLVACAAGLGLLFVAGPQLHIALKVVGAAYMLWLAYKVATAHLANDAKATARPFTFWQAAAFQWVNPKAVVAAVSAIAIYVRPDHQSFDIPIMLLALTAATLGSVLTWSAFGVALRGLLREPARARVLNFTMALLLVTSIVPLVLSSQR
jgi:threonine/homoserine/homoserine lactone efflux protein